MSEDLRSKYKRIMKRAMLVARMCKKPSSRSDTSPDKQAGSEARPGRLAPQSEYSDASSRDGGTLRSSVERARVKAEMLPDARVRRMSVVKALARAAIMMHRMQNHKAREQNPVEQEQQPGSGASLAAAEASIETLRGLRAALS